MSREQLCMSEGCTCETDLSVSERWASSWGGEHEVGATSFPLAPIMQSLIKNYLLESTFGPDSASGAELFGIDAHDLRSHLVSMLMIWCLVSMLIIREGYPCGEHSVLRRFELLDWRISSARVAFYSTPLLDAEPQETRDGDSLWNP